MRAAQKGINNRRRTGREGRARSAAGGPVFHAGLHQPTKPHRTLPLIRWFASLILLLAPALALAQTHDITQFGAVADGRTLNTAAIQRAIDECAAAGGGEVRVPPGVFVTGSLLLKSNLTLRLMPGAVLQGSQDPADYPDHDISSHKKFGTITDGGYS